MALIDPADSVERQNEKLLVIAESLMRRVEQKNEDTSLAYQQFERAALLETQVRERTRDLERTLDLLQESNARLEKAGRETETARANLTEAIEAIGDGFALFGPDDRLVLYNSRFCRDLADVEPKLEPGLAFADYIALVSGSAHLSLPAGHTSQSWARQRLARHDGDGIVFNVALSNRRWLQISDHRTERGGTVILQTDVTDLVQIERDKRDRMRFRQAQMLQATLDRLNQGVCIFDGECNLVGWNRKMDGVLAMPSSRTTVTDMPFHVLLDRMAEEVTFRDPVDHARFRA